jgi:hypothetical protein
VSRSERPSSRASRYLAPQLGADLGIEPRGRLVEEQDLRPVHERHRDVEPPLHAAGVGADQAAGGVGEAELIEQLAGSRRERTPVQAVDLPLQAQVLRPRGPAVDAGALADDADRPPHRGRGVHDVVSRHPGHAGIGARERGEDADRRRLAGSVRPEQAEDRAGAYRQAEAVERRDFAGIRLDQTVRFDG